MRMGPLLDPATFLRDAPETQVEEDTPLTSCSLSGAQSDGSVPTPYRLKMLKCAPRPTGRWDPFWVHSRALF